MNAARRPSLFWPLVLIGLGAILLLQNYGLLPPNLWDVLAQLWPVLLILLGLDMLIGRRSSGSALLVLLLGVLVVAAALTWTALRASALPPGGSQTLVQFPGDARAASVRLDLAVGDLHLAALDDPTRLMAGQVNTRRGETVDQRYYLADGAGLLVLAQRREALFAPFVARDGHSRWDIRLTAHLPLTLEVRTQVGAADLDLSALNVNALTLTTGVGQTSVSFPFGGVPQAVVQSGVGDLTLTIPADLPTRITVKSGLAGVHVPSRFSRAGNVYATPGFSTLGAHLDLEVQAGAGSITVK